MIRQSNSILNGKSYNKGLEPDDLELKDIKDENGNVVKKFKKTDIKGKGTTEFGFIAQEIKEIYPELVQQDSLGYYSVNYTGLIPVLVEVIKQQRSDIDAQKKQLEELTLLVDKIIKTKK